MEAIDAEMFLPVATDIYAKAIGGQLALGGRSNDQPSDEIGLAPRFTEQLVCQKRGLVEEAHDVGEGGDVVREVTTAAGPDDQEGDGVEAAECDQGVVGRHRGGDANVSVLRVPECDEDAAGQNRDGQGDEAQERDPGHFIVAVDDGLQGDLDWEGGGVGEENAFVCGCAARSGKLDEGLQGAEVGVDGLPGEEEEVPNQRRDEAVKEVRGGECACSWQSWELGREAALDGVVDEADRDECDEEGKHDDYPCGDGSFAQEVRSPAVPSEWGV